MSHQLSVNRSNLFFAGVDGGGSSTRVIIASKDGDVCGFGQAGSCNPNYVGVDAASDALRAAFAAAWADASHGGTPISGAFLGIAGMNAFRRQSHPQRLVAWLSRTADAKIEFDHDLRIALAGSLGGQPGIVVIAGTGSAGYGRTATGEAALAGGWGALLDDVGGGYWLAVQALSAVARAIDGRSPATALHELILDRLNLSSAPDLPNWLSRPETTRAKIAELAPLVFEGARGGDVVALQLLERGAEELASIAGAVAGKLRFGATHVALTGGLSQNSEYKVFFHQALAQRLPQLTLKPAQLAPVVGALLLAFQQAGQPFPKERITGWWKARHIQTKG